MYVDVIHGEVKREGSSLDVSEGTLQLMTLLAVMGRPVRREVVLDFLWPELDGDNADNALKVCVHRARRQLGDANAIVTAQRVVGLGECVTTNYFEVLELSASMPPLTPELREQLNCVFESLAQGLVSGRAHWHWFAPYQKRLARAAHAIGRLLIEDGLEHGRQEVATQVGDLLNAIVGM